jgi:hypothetical protein
VAIAFFHGKQMMSQACAFFEKARLQWVVPKEGNFL